MHKKALLLILDGWGIGQNSDHNAIFQAQPKFWNEIYGQYPHSLIHCKEESVGLPSGCLSGSEVGHMTIGAGRVVWQNVAKIDRSIADGSWNENKILISTKEHLEKDGGKLHLVGLLSNGGIHSHVNHILALISWARREKIKQVALHLFLDGRDMPPTSALQLLRETVLKEIGEDVKISTICGRSIAMDRGEKWERTITTFNLLTNTTEISNETVENVLEKNYQEKIGDEFVEPTRFNDWGVAENDAVIFFNFRADRMRQLVRLFTKIAPHAEQQMVVVPENLHLASLTEYDSEYREVWVMYPTESPTNTLGEWVASKGLRQLRITETEKQAHVTYFLNGGREEVFAGEDRLIIPSLGLTNYASNPEMSLPEITSSLVRALDDKVFDLVVCNIANGDMVGHSGSLEAGKKAVQAVDVALSQIIPVAEKSGYITLITADHGNIEHMWENGEPHTAHTFNEVPLVVVDKNIILEPTGHLHQIAPTVLQVMGLDKPAEMTSGSLIK